MKTEYERLKLKQARRRELPSKMVAVWFWAIGLMLACGLVENCARDQVKPITKAEQKHATEMLWSDHAKTFKKRLP